MKKIKFFERGISLAFVVIMAASMGILMIAVSDTLKYVSNQHNYLANMDRAMRASETGLNSALGYLLLNPGSVPANGDFYPSPNNPGVDSSTNFSYWIAKRSTPTIDSYYIVVSATNTYYGKKYWMMLHSYVRVSNTGDYLMAIADEVNILDGTDASNGKVYAPKLSFDISKPGRTTRVKRAEYVDEPLSPLAGSGNYVNPGTNNGKIEITEPSGVYRPVKLPFRLLFPQVLDTDIDTFKEKAHVGTANQHIKCNFSGEIFPPGYAGGQLTNDTYPSAYTAPALGWHTNDNLDKVYYCPENMYIRGEVYGQVIFVTTNTIFITGDLIKHPDIVPPIDIPGEGFVSSSTAHEAILVTRQNVMISNNFYGAWGSRSPAGAQQKIEAFILAPHGTFSAVQYTDPVPATNANNEFHDNLELVFKGSMILSVQPQTFSVVFATRSYTYDDDLRNHPPPYMPALAQIIVSQEQIMNK